MSKTNQRLTRVNELIRREIADMMFRIVVNPGFDLSAVTVSHVITSANLRHARVLVSIRDHEDERNKMLRVLRKHAQDFNQHLRKTLKLKYIPRLTFELDDSIEAGDRVLDLISRLDIEPDQEPDHEESTREDSET